MHTHVRLEVALRREGSLADLALERAFTWNEDSGVALENTVPVGLERQAPIRSFS